VTKTNLVRGMIDDRRVTAIRNDIIEITAKALSKRIQTTPETGRMNFASLGVDSVNAFDILNEIEKRYSVTLADDFLLIEDNPDKAARAIDAMLEKRGCPPGVAP